MKRLFVPFLGACLMAIFALVPSVFAQNLPHKVVGLTIYDAPTYEALQSVFKHHQYSLNPWTGKVPTIAPKHIPQNLKQASVTTRKQLFIQMMIPLIVQANAQIESERTTVTKLVQAYQTNGTLNSAEHHILQPIANRYKATGDMDKILTTLQYRVQPIPVALALAQAILESGWGTSRFAREGNSLFGQWTYTTGNGLTPEDRDVDKTHMVKAFDTPYDSVVSYIANLNRHGAYADLRKIRYYAVKNNKPVTAHDMAAGLEKYSQLGYDYVVKIRKLIRSNGLEKYNMAGMQP